MITFRALTEADLPMLHQWLSRPHVTAWWEPETTLDAVREDYLPRLAGDEVLPLDAPAGVTQYLAWEDGVPFAYLQAYRVMAHQPDGWWLDERDPHALGSDQFIGLPDHLDRGVGTRMLKAFLAFLFEDPRVTSVQADPEPENHRAIAAYRKAGFRDVGLTPTPDGEAFVLKAVRP